MIARRMASLLLVFSLLLGFFFVLGKSVFMVQAAGIRYAASVAVGSGDCSSWADACTLQTALATAIDGDEIWVAEGVHKPGVNLTDTFQLANGVAVYGGFTGTETDLSQRDPSTNVTVLSGDIDDNDTTDVNGIVVNPNHIVGNNSLHIVTGNNTDSSTVLDGVTVTAGKAITLPYPNNCGGGVIVDNGSPTFVNVTFKGNIAFYGGGLCTVYGSDASLTNVTFSNNEATYGGGGMYNAYASPQLNDVTFSNNDAFQFGGGMLIHTSNPTLNDISFSYNYALRGGGLTLGYNSAPTLTNIIFYRNDAKEGGGLHNYDIVSATLTHVSFIENTAYDGGGFYSIDDGNPTLTNVTFVDNSARWDGGGMHNRSSNPTLSNVTFSGNLATFANGRGGGVFNYASSPQLFHATFSNNAAYVGGGMYNTTNSRPKLNNVIMWDNQALTAPQIYNTGTSRPQVAYSDIEGSNGSGGSWNASVGRDRGHNIDVDPLLAPLANNGGATQTHALQSGSPVIDTIPYDINGCGTTITTDQRGKTRPQGVHCDMGAYEYVGTGTAVSPTLNITYTTSPTATLVWTDDIANCVFDIYTSTMPYGGYLLWQNGLTTLTVDDESAIGNTRNNKFYYLVAYACGNTNTALSNKVGEFDFAVLPGS